MSRLSGELVVFDPEDPDTYPSVCHTADDVKDRFGFTGGEVLLFTLHGSYVGQIVKQLEAEKLMPKPISE